MDLFLKILSICSAVGLPSLFTIGCFVVRYVKKHLDIQKQESDALKLGMQAMLRDTILKRGKDLVLKGEASYAEKENIEHLYEQYKALGGNGIIDKLYKEVLELPLI